MTNRQKAWMLAASLLAACTPSVEENPTPRCVEGVCPAGSYCYRGFCLAQDEATIDASTPPSAMPVAREDAMPTSPPRPPVVVPPAREGGDSGGSPTTGNGGGMLPLDDAGVAAPLEPDEGDAGPPPSPGEQTCAFGCCLIPGHASCGDRCVDLRSSEAHCGACGNACRAGRACKAGLCCKGRESACDGACVDLEKDDENCGICGLSCLRGSCKNGLCRGDP